MRADGGGLVARCGQVWYGRQRQDEEKGPTRSGRRAGSDDGRQQVHVVRGEQDKRERERERENGEQRTEQGEKGTSQRVSSSKKSKDDFSTRLAEPVAKTPLEASPGARARAENENVDLYF